MSNRAPASSEISGLTDDPAEQPPNEPNVAPRFYDDMSRKELDMPNEKRGYRNRDARPPLNPRLVAMGQMTRKRARGDPEDESSAARKRPFLAVL